MAQFGKHDLEVALRKFGMLRFFPPDPATRTEIGILLAKIVPSREALDWLVDAMVNRVGEWKGPAELRAVLCWRYRPLDGIEADSQIAGFKPSDGERLYEAAHVENSKPLEISAPPRKQLSAPVSAASVLETIRKDWES